MYSKLAHKNYTSIQISTVDRGKLLLMMYDGGLKFLAHARDALTSKDIPKFARYLSKSQAIIAELMHTLDFEKGGQIAKDLDRLYDFMLYYLTEANLQKDPKKVQKVIDLLSLIAGAYREILEGKSEFLREAQQLAGIAPEETRGNAAKAPTRPAENKEAATEVVARSLRVAL